jgi:hypothetical protein
MHGLFYSSDPAATRAFFKEQVKLPGTDIGEGWWIFDVPQGDLGVHPIEDASDAGAHDVSFYCDDIQGTVADLKSRGVEFTSEVEDHGYGLVTHFKAPGGITVQLYEPRYAKSPSRPTAPKSTKARTAGRVNVRRRAATASRRQRDKKGR